MPRHGVGNTLNGCIGVSFDVKRMKIKPVYGGQVKSGIHIFSTAQIDFDPLPVCSEIEHFESVVNGDPF